jgi:hypothetical protein
MFSRTSRILLAVALLAAGAYLLFERPRERAQDRNQAASDKLTSFDAASIDSIAIERPQDTLVFERADSLWRMVAPVSDSAEPGAIGTLLHALSTADIAPGAESDLAPYGPTPSSRLRRASSCCGSQSARTVDNAWLRTLHRGDVLLVPTDVHQSSTMPWTSTATTRPDSERCDRNTVSTELSMSWTRRGTTWYALAGRDTVAGDSVAVLSPLHRLRGLRAAHVLQGDAAPTPPADSVRTMTVWIGPAHPTEITFTHSATGWNALVGTRNMAVNDDLSDLFAHTTTELRDRRLLQFDPAVTERIVVVAPATGGEIPCRRTWSFPNPALGRVDPGRAADFVRALRGLKWSEPGGEAAQTGAHFLFRIEISGAGGKMIDVLTAGPYDAATCWVASPSSRGSWLIARSTLDDIAARFAHVKQR